MAQTSKFLKISEKCSVIFYYTDRKLRILSIMYVIIIAKNYLSNTEYHIVTCQPIVGLRSSALLGNRQLNASLPNTRHAAVGEAGSFPRRRDDVTRTRSRGISRDLRVAASDVTQPSPGSLLRDGPGNRQQCRWYD
jgi:ABC-type phosphonate transport system ATPase subunit